MVRSNPLTQTRIYAGFLSGLKELGTHLQLITFAESVVYILISVGTVVHCRNYLWVKIFFCWVLGL